MSNPVRQERHTYGDSIHRKSFRDPAGAGQRAAPAGRVGSVRPAGAGERDHHGLLRTLQAEGLVEQDPETGKYQLGAGLLQLGNSYLDVNELRARSIAWSDRLASSSGEAVRVGTLHGDGVIVIHHVFRMDNTLQIPEVGAHLPLHATALGKALIAHHQRSPTTCWRAASPA